jgi:hypothetical protein
MIPSNFILPGSRESAGCPKDFVIHGSVLPRSDIPGNVGVVSSPPSLSSHSHHSPNTHLVDSCLLYSQQIRSAHSNYHTPDLSLEARLFNIRSAASESLPNKVTRHPKKGDNILPSPFRPSVPANRRILMWSSPHSLRAQQELDHEIATHMQV